MALKDRVFPHKNLEADPIREAVTERPQIHTAIHPRRHESLFAQMYACRDALYDEHSDIVQITKHTLVGAFLGVAVGYSSLFILKRFPTFTMRRIFRHIRENQFGTLHILKETLMPFALGGAVTGISYYCFWRAIWGFHGKAFDSVVGNAVFGALAVSFLHNPKQWWIGFYAGGLIGFAFYSLVYRNSFGYKEYGQVSLKLQGLSEEEREKIKNQDTILELGMNPLIASGKVSMF